MLHRNRRRSRRPTIRTVQTTPSLRTIDAVVLKALRIGACAALLATTSTASLAADPQAAGLLASACPAGLAAGSRCRSGRDELGAYVWLAIPPDWNGTLVVHSHGGPELGPPKAERALEDLQRWSVWNRAGYAYAGSGYHQGGVAVESAAADTERVRTIFVAEFGIPKRTILHGQSWGAGVAAKAAGTFAAPAAGKPPYDGVLLTSGVLGGGSESYDFRLDLRVVYEAVCGNHPAADEPAYPLWQGLPQGATLTRAELAQRVDACTGVRQKAAERTPQQQRHLDRILAAVAIPERSLVGHLAWATWHFQDIAFARLGGRNAFSNIGVRYIDAAGSGDLDERVARYAADPAARAAFAADAGLAGRIAVPVLTMHAIDDPTAFVELESTFRERMVQGGSADRLVQTFTDEHEHSYLADAEYVAAMAALMAWVERGEKPTPQGIAAACLGVDAAFAPAAGCRFRPDYRPRPLASRVPPR